MPLPGFLLSQERRDGYECLHFASELTGVSGLPRPGSRIQCGMTGVSVVVPLPGFLLSQDDGGEKRGSEGGGIQCGMTALFLVIPASLLSVIPAEERGSSDGCKVPPLCTEARRRQ
jgi:hypothetical protein